LQTHKTPQKRVPSVSRGWDVCRPPPAACSWASVNHLLQSSDRRIFPPSHLSPLSSRGQCGQLEEEASRVVEAERGGADRQGGGEEEMEEREEVVKMSGPC